MTRSGGPGSVPVLGDHGTRRGRSPAAGGKRRGQRGGRTVDALAWSRRRTVSATVIVEIVFTLDAVYRSRPWDVICWSGWAPESTSTGAC